MFLLGLDDLSILILISSKEHVHCFDYCYNINHFDWNCNSRGFVLLFAVFIFPTNKNSFVTYCIHQGSQNNLSMSIGISLQCPAQYKVTWGRAGPKRIENVLSWEKCSSHCRERPECNYWTWFDENNRIPKDTKNVCITMTKGRVKKRRKAHTWSGTRQCGGEILNISSSGPLLHVSLLSV